MAEDRIMQRYEEQLPVDGLDASLKVSTHVLVYLPSFVPFNTSALWHLSRSRFRFLHRHIYTCVYAYISISTYLHLVCPDTYTFVYVNVGRVCLSGH